MDVRLTRLMLSLEYKAALARGDAAKAAEIEEQIGALEPRQRGARQAMQGRALPVVQLQEQVQGTPLPNIPRICATCCHFSFQSAEQGYSSYTPGSDVHISCGRGVWAVDNYAETERGYREKMLMALVCDDYHLVGGLG